MSKMQRTKGYRGEHEAVLLLADYGIPAVRKQGNREQGPDLATGVGLVEVKRRSASSTLVYDALRKPADWVLHRDDNQPWLLSARAHHILRILRAVRVLIDPTEYPAVRYKEAVEELGLLLRHDVTVEWLNHAAAVEPVEAP